MRSSITLARSTRRLAVALGFALLHVGVAGAADLCVQYGNGLFTTTLAAKSWRMPRKGQCRSLTGVKTYSGISDRATVEGTGCTTTDGTTLRLAWTEFHPTGVLFKRIDLPLPLGPAGAAYRIEPNAGSTQYAVPPVAVPCDPTATVVY